MKKQTKHRIDFHYWITHWARQLGRFKGAILLATSALTVISIMVTCKLQFNSDFTKTQESLDAYSKNILSASDELKSADSHLKETLQNSQSLLSDMKTQFTDLSEKNSDTIDTFAQNVDKFMNDYHQHVEKAIKDNVVHQLDTTLGAYAHTMSEAITSLSDAIDELREKEIK